MLNDPNPIIIVSNQGKCLTPPLDTGLKLYVHDTWRTKESSIPTEVPRAEPEHELNQNQHHKWKPKTEQWNVQVQKPVVNLNLD